MRFNHQRNLSAFCQVFHRTRRAFLRQLLFDVSAALQELGQEHWLDFGCLLGVHRCAAGGGAPGAAGVDNGDWVPTRLS